MEMPEAEGLVQSVEDAGGAFVREETSEGEAGVIVDGDVETFDAGAWVAMSAVTSGADAWAMKAAELLDVDLTLGRRGMNSGVGPLTPEARFFDTLRQPQNDKKGAQRTARRFERAFANRRKTVLIG